jgi:acetylornithine deacetylase/succinyl-diaminopimelate desuccinylase-like protein
VISPGFNDGHYLVRNLGIPTISYGPGSMGQAHTPDEYIVADDLIRGTRVLAEVVLKLLT